ncbi:MAG: glycosyltransferase, partial [Candidatus Omnitrophica bacterium]|nr:glycosyltransferase [Candidatus Omnitrophota bacterium]
VNILLAKPWIRFKRYVRQVCSDCLCQVRNIQVLSKRNRFWPFVHLLVSSVLLMVSILWLCCAALVSTFYLLWYSEKVLWKVCAWFSNSVLKRKHSGVFDFNARVDELIRQYDRCFPERRDRLVRDDFRGYREDFRRWAKLIAKYDLVEGYATDPIYPMLVGTKPYVAYEHGTIREIPFQTTGTGRLCALSYRLADFTVITNPDCIDAAKKLGLEHYRYIPHVLDRKYFNQTGLYDSKNPLEPYHPYVFCPSRHDWELKGTHHAIEGFARFCKQYPEFHMIMSRWGTDVKRSRELITSLGIERNITLMDPVSICNLIRVAHHAFALIDQFVLFFGGIAPTALAVGVPLIAHVDFSKCRWCYDEQPPYFEAHDDESVYRALVQIKECDRQAYAQKAREWVLRNYNYQDVIGRHLEIYEKLLMPQKQMAEEKEMVRSR